MFGNSELKETKLKLDIAINIATEIFTGMDPVMRPLYLKKYKSMINYYDRCRGSCTFISDISNDIDRKHVEDNKEVIRVLREVVKKVEIEIAGEEYEGSSYGFNIGIPYDISVDKNSLYNRLIKLLSEDFPGLYQLEEKDKEDLGKKYDDDLLANISNEKSLELKASQVISELNEDDDPYIGDIDDDEELDEDSNTNLEFGISGCPIDSEAFSTAIYVRILGRDMISIQEERNRISAATRYVAHLIELFSKESIYERNDDFEKNKFLNTLINLKNETTNILLLTRFVLENINECYELFHIGRRKFDKRGYQTDYESNDEFLENLNFEEVISMISGAWEDSLDSKKMEEIRILAKKIPESFFEKKDKRLDKADQEITEELEVELTKEEYGTAEYPRDVKSYYQAIFYQLMLRQVLLNKKGTPMSNATRSSIQLICDYVTPLNEDKDGEYTSPKFLLLFKEKITNIKTFIIWMDAMIRENLDGLKIGDSEDDFYKTPQNFINDIDSNEIIDLLTIAWENSKDEEMMKKIRPFEKEVKEKWNDSE